ncbi:hypothetical protein KY362_00125, partial [Candidatus Woesearchaeota archaeon]|nr:hypothetical protein [Candidatus Woesearchaeota archaeon]
MESRATKTENHAKLTDTGHSSASKRALWKKLSLLFTLFMTILLINVAAALAQYQSHNVSEIRNIDADWNFYAAAGARDIQVPNGGICIDSGQTTCTGTAGQISADVLWKNGVGEVDGDITAVTTSGGITGGTSDGAASISLDTTGCVAYESLRRNSANTAWECVIPDYYTGDITDVIAGNGLTGGATIGSATINVGSGTGITVAADSISADCTAILGHA